ncbi:hypothetical protein IEQ34_003881 [Dendrobium chrysotoxum]|uniref:Arginosuccinate synthase-like N-terminal domain-containing protein n=1 Tax=Dendrobium chrysotoxum TaxID=161865 RepID=A0AAV7HGL5_DENCH|nr:hypothetical protein IEQ34_003881 [Dendrobium chrysotoxum]
MEDPMEVTVILAHRDPYPIGFTSFILHLITIPIAGVPSTLCLLDAWVKHLQEMEIRQKNEFEKVEKGLKKYAEVRRLRNFVLDGNPTLQDPKKQLSGHELTNWNIRKHQNERKHLLGTSIICPVTAKVMVDVAKDVGAGAVSHGCTRKGNSLVQLELTFFTLNPESKVVAH